LEILRGRGYKTPIEGRSRGKLETSSGRGIDNFGDSAICY